MKITVEQANMLARTARTIAHSHYVAHCERIGTPAQGLTGHKTWSKAECVQILKQARADIEHYTAMIDDKPLDAEIIALAGKLGITAADI